MYPMITQEMDLWCWAAVAQSVHKFFDSGSTLRQCQIAQPLTGLDCCGAERLDCDVAWVLEDALREVGHYRADFQGRVDFDYIRQSLQADRPICVRIEWGMGGLGHFVVICGYIISQSGEPWLTIADPKRGISRWPYDQFSFAYRGLGEWTDTYLVKR